MADISPYKDTILNHERGESVRDAIINSILLINSAAEDTKRLGNMSSDEYASFTDMLPLIRDKYPTKDSNCVVESNGLFEVIGDCNNLEEAVSGTIAAKIKDIYESFLDICQSINNKKVAWPIGSPIMEYGNVIRNLFRYELLTLTVTKNGTYEMTEPGRIWKTVIVNMKSGGIPAEGITDIKVTENGEYVAPEGTGYGNVTVEVENDYVFEYDYPSRKGKISCLFGTTNDEITKSQTNDDISDLISTGASSEDVYKYVMDKNGSVDNYLDAMMNNGYDTNSNALMTTLFNNDNTLNVDDMYDYFSSKLNPSEFINSAMGSNLSEGIDNVPTKIVKSFSDDGMSVDEIVASITGSGNDKVDYVSKFIEDLSTSPDYIPNKEEIIEKLEESIDG